MVSKFELSVRELDDESENISVNARKIAQKLGRKEGTIINLLIAKRKGYVSFKDYRRENQRRRGFQRAKDYYDSLARKKNLNNYQEYTDLCAQKNGFLGANEYNEFARIKRRGGDLTQRDYQERGAEIPGEYKNPEFFDTFPTSRLSLLQSIHLQNNNSQLYSLVHQLINQLSPKYLKVIQGRFFEGRTLDNISKELDISRQRVNQIESNALNKLYHLVKQVGLDELYFSRGENGF